MDKDGMEGNAQRHHCIACETYGPTVGRASTSGYRQHRTNASRPKKEGKSRDALLIVRRRRRPVARNRGNRKTRRSRIANEDAELRLLPSAWLLQSLHWHWHWHWHAVLGRASRLILLGKLIRTPCLTPSSPNPSRMPTPPQPFGPQNKHVTPPNLLRRNSNLELATSNTASQDLLRITVITQPPHSSSSSSSGSFLTSPTSSHPTRSHLTSQLNPPIYHRHHVYPPAPLSRPARHHGNH